MKILILNCGSSSLKFQLFEMPEEKVNVSDSKNIVNKLHSSEDLKTGINTIFLIFSEFITVHKNKVFILAIGFLQTF